VLGIWDFVGAAIPDLPVPGLVPGSLPALSAVKGVEGQPRSCGDMG